MVNLFLYGRKKAVQSNRNDTTKATKKTTQKNSNQDHENCKSVSFRAVEDHYTQPNAFVNANSSAYVNTVKKPTKTVEVNHSDYDDKINEYSCASIACPNNTKYMNNHIYEQLKVFCKKISYCSTIYFFTVIKEIVPKTSTIR